MKTTHSIFTSLIALATASSAHAAVIIQSASNARFDDWNDAIWGSPTAAVPTTGNDYQTASGLVIRTPEANSGSNNAAKGPSSTFGGDSLELVEGSGFLLKNNSGTTSTVTGAFTLSGGTVFHGPSFVNNMTFAVGSFTTSGVSDIAVSRGNMNITSDLTGSGALHLGDTLGEGLYTVSFTGINSFTGSLTLGAADADSIFAYGNDVALSLGTNDYTFQDTVTILNSSILDVGTGQTLTFNFGDLVDANNGTVAAGTYTTAALGANYSGAGSIVVIPEPSTTLLLGLASLGLIIRRRRI